MQRVCHFNGGKAKKKKEKRKFFHSSFPEPTEGGEDADTRVTWSMQERRTGQQQQEKERRNLDVWERVLFPRVEDKKEG